MEGTQKAMAKESKAENYEGRTNYEGVFYDFKETESVEISSESDGQGTYGHREPDSNLWNNGTHEDDYLKEMQDKLTEEAERYKDHATFIKTMQEDYNEMIESVKTYGGLQEMIKKK